MWVRHRSVVLVPPEGGLEFSAGLTKKIVICGQVLLHFASKEAGLGATGVPANSIPSASHSMKAISDATSAHSSVF